ncbi:MAG: patatin family protein [Prevotellaceae bacterium]|nr:patatin family protein [Prevotellaceae bacterium]
MKKGLVLEGGGLRSLFSEGVFDVLLENDICFDGAIGVSAGASIGCNMKTKQIGRGLRYNSNLAHDKRYISLWSLFTSGDIVNREFSYHVVPFKHDIIDVETYDNNPMEFHAVCTDVQTGEMVVKRLDKMDHESLDWLCASLSMPIVSRPVELDGKKLLDGGIVNSIPLEYFQQLGYEKNLVILTQPKGYKKHKTKLMPLFRIFCRKYPAIIRAMARSHEMYNDQLAFIAEQESKGKTLVICPDEVLPIGRIEMKPEKMKVVYDMGRRAGLANLERIKQFLNEE